MINDLKIVKKFNLLKDNNIIIYECKNDDCTYLVQLLEYAGCKVEAIITENYNKTFSLHTEVILYKNFKEIKDVNTAQLIIIITSFSEEIVNLISNNLKVENIFTQFSCKLSVFINYSKMNVDNVFKWHMEEKKSLYRKLTFQTNRAYIREHCLDLYNQAVLVYNPAKVGSSSLYKSIEASGMNACHCHTLYSLIQHENNKKLIKYRDNAISQFKGKVIISVREPISRDISHFFQLLWNRLSVLCVDYKIEDIEKGFLDIYYKSMVNNTDYNEKYSFETILLNNSQKGVEFDWFDYELKKFLGNKDIYEFPFDKENGYSIYNISGHDIMILQLEKMDELVEVIGNFLGIENFKLKKSNVASNKEYGILYKNFMDNLKLKKEYIDFYYLNNKWFNHFYTEKQRKCFEEKWRKVQGDY